MQRLAAQPPRCQSVLVFQRRWCERKPAPQALPGPMPQPGTIAWAACPAASSSADGKKPSRIVSAVAAARPPHSSAPWRSAGVVGRRLAHEHVDDDPQVVERGRRGVEDRR